MKAAVCVLPRRRPRLYLTDLDRCGSMGNMPVLLIFGIVVLIACALILLFGLVCYVRFCRTPEKLWRDQVFTLLVEARWRLATDQQELKELHRRRDAELRG